MFEREQQIHRHNRGEAGSALQVSAQKPQQRHLQRSNEKPKQVQKDRFESVSPSGPAQIQVESISPKGRRHSRAKKRRKVVGTRSRSCDIRLTPKPLEHAEFRGVTQVNQDEPFIKGAPGQNAESEMLANESVKTMSEMENKNAGASGVRPQGLIREETPEGELREGLRGKTFSVLTAETRGTITSQKRKVVNKGSKLKVLREKTIPERKSRIAKLNKTQKIFLTFEGTIFLFIQLSIFKLLLGI